jgi:hypothetical protein
MPMVHALDLNPRDAEKLRGSPQILRGSHQKERDASLLCGAGRIVRRMLVIVQPDIVRFRDIRQPVDGIQHLRQAAFVLLVHGSQ